MPRRVPMAVPVSSQEDIATKVWAYVSRRLTSLAIPADIVKFLAKGTGTEVPADKSLYDLIALDRLDKYLNKGAGTELPTDKSLYDILGLENPLLKSEFETEWSTDPVVQNVASDLAIALTAGSFTPAYPSGAIEVRAILLPLIKIASQAAATHHIGFKVQYRTGGAGPYSDLKDYTLNPPLGLVAVDGAVDSWCQPIDVSAIVSSGVQVEFRFEVDSDNAGSVNYTTSFVLLLVYRMG